MVSWAEALIVGSHPSQGTVDLPGQERSSAKPSRAGGPEPLFWEPLTHAWLPGCVRRPLSAPPLGNKVCSARMSPPTDPIRRACMAVTSVSERPGLA